MALGNCGLAQSAEHRVMADGSNPHTRRHKASAQLIGNHVRLVVFLYMFLPTDYGLLEQPITRRN